MKIKDDTVNAHASVTRCLDGFHLRPLRQYPKAGPRETCVLVFTSLRKKRNSRQAEDTRLTLTRHSLSMPPMPNLELEGAKKGSTFKGR